MDTKALLAREPSEILRVKAFARRFSTEDAGRKPGGIDQWRRGTVSLIADKIGFFAVPMVKSLPHKGSGKKGSGKKSLWC